MTDGYSCQPGIMAVSTKEATIMVIQNNYSWIFRLVLLGVVVVLALGILIDRQITYSGSVPNSTLVMTATFRPATATARVPTPTAAKSNITTLAALAGSVKATEMANSAAIRLTEAAAVPLINATATEVVRQAQVKATNDRISSIASVAGLTQTPAAWATQQAIERRRMDRQDQIIEAGFDVGIVVTASTILILGVAMACRLTLIERKQAIEAERRRIEAETQRLATAARLAEAEAQQLRESRRNAQVAMPHASMPAISPDPMKPHSTTDRGNGEGQMEYTTRSRV